jgi:hypothetical protein
MYKNYFVKKLEFLKFKKLHKKDARKSLLNLMEYYRNNLKYEKKNLIDRLKNIFGKVEYEKKFPNKKDFDQNLKRVMESFKKYEESLIKNDFSYNLVHIPEFTNYAYEYLNE